MTPATNNRKTTAQQIGVEYTMGAARPFYNQGTAVLKKDDGTKAFDAKSSQYGVRYDLSKRTTAYFITGKVEDNAATTTTIKERKATGLGLMHSF